MMVVHCAVCGYQWTLRLKLPIPLTRFVTAMRGFTAAGCPRCGAHGRDVRCGPANRAGNKGR